MNAMNAKIAARIVALMNTGMDIRTAFDAVIGTGAYDALAAEVYDALKAKAVAQ